MKLIGIYLIMNYALLFHLGYPFGGMITMSGIATLAADYEY